MYSKFDAFVSFKVKLNLCSMYLNLANSIDKTPKYRTDDKNLSRKLVIRNNYIVKMLTCREVRPRNCTHSLIRLVVGICGYLAIQSNFIDSEHGSFSESTHTRIVFNTRMRLIDTDDVQRLWQIRLGVNMKTEIFYDTLILQDGYQKWFTTGRKPGNIINLACLWMKLLLLSLFRYVWFSAEPLFCGHQFSEIITVLYGWVLLLPSSINRILKRCSTTTFSPRHFLININVSQQL